MHAILASQWLDQAFQSLVSFHIVAVPNTALDLHMCTPTLLLMLSCKVHESDMGRVGMKPGHMVYLNADCARQSAAVCYCPP